MRRTILHVLLLAAATVAPLAAQPPQPPRGSPPGAQPDPFARHLFPPELVMQNQRELGLTDAQRTALKNAVQQAQAKALDTQWRLSAEGEKLETLIEGPTVDETQTLEQVDRILAIERELKRAQIGLLVRIKNTLTPPQQAKLLQMRQTKE